MHALINKSLFLGKEYESENSYIDPHEDIKQHM